MSTARASSFGLVRGRKLPRPTTQRAWPI